MPQELSFGSVLAAIHPDYFPGGRELGREPAGWPTEVKLLLERSTPITIEVLDASGMAVPGATVHHVGGARAAANDEAVYERFLALEATTDASGHAELAPFRGEQAFWAEKNDLVSIPWQGPRPSRVVLRLGDSFTVAGSITFANRDEWEPDYEGERRILVSGGKGNLWWPLARLRDVEQGAWGPLRIPLESFTSFKVRLEGAPIAPIEETIDRPPRAAHRRIDFVAEKLAQLHLLVRDEHDQPITTARAVVWWGTADMPTGPAHAEGAAKPDGWIYIGSFPPGSVQFRVTAPGYALVEMGAQVPGDDLLVTLQKGGKLSGRCTHDGNPVTDFEVIYWLEGNVRRYRSQSFFDRGDGSFELDSLPPGDWSIHAGSLAYPSCKPVIVEVSAERETQVELELPTAIRGGGRVVDANTGEAVSSARVQAYSSGGMAGRSFPWGEPVSVEVDGTFEQDAFVLGSNYISVEAEGYATSEARAHAVTDGFLDWGDIRLFRSQALQITLLAVDELVEFQASDLRVSGREGPLMNEKRFSREGTVRYEGVSPGDTQVFVSYPDDSWARLHLRLDPGKSWDFDLKIAGDRTLDVLVLDENGRPPSFIVLVAVAAQEETGTYVFRTRQATEDGRARFEGIRATEVQVIIISSDGKPLARRDISFGSNPSMQVDIQLGDEPFRVHVVDANDAPVPGAWVTIRSTSGSEIHAVDDTGSDGWASLVGAPAGQVLMDVSHGIAGKRFGVPVDASADDLEFVLEATGILELELRDGEQPLAGVATRIETTGGVTLSAAMETDEQGLVRYEPLGEGSYHIACRRADCWPAVVDEDLGADEHARVTVQMRRLADLELVVLSDTGLPVTGVAVDLVSIEFDLPVEAWLEDEKIRAPGGLTTDEQGKIHVEGLPRGKYTWSVSLGGQTATGTFDLDPVITNDVVIHLPE